MGRAIRHRHGFVVQDRQLEQSLFCYPPGDRGRDLVATREARCFRFDHIVALRDGEAERREAQQHVRFADLLGPVDQADPAPPAGDDLDHPLRCELADELVRALAADPELRCDLAQRRRVAPFQVIAFDDLERLQLAAGHFRRQPKVALAFEHHALRSRPGARM